MVNEIHVKNEFLSVLEEPVQDFLKNISFDNEPIFYLINHTVEGKVEKDLCQMMNEMIEFEKITYEEKTSIKNFYSLHKNEEKNLAKYRNNISEEELKNIENITNKIKNHNLSHYKQNKKNIENNIYPQIVNYVKEIPFERKYYERVRDIVLD
jgi:hypothetical protein